MILAMILILLIILALGCIMDSMAIVLADHPCISIPLIIGSGI